MRTPLFSRDFCTMLLVIFAGLTPQIAVTQDEIRAQVPEAAQAQEFPGAMLDFEQDEPLSSWTASDQEATLSITHEPDHVATGQGALEFSYNARPGVYQYIYTDALRGQQANALSVKLKASSPTSFSLILQEAAGAHYQGLFWIEAGKWVTVRTLLDDLILTPDTSDANTRPDADQIIGFSLADLSNLPGEVGLALGRKSGEQKLWLDDLALCNEPTLRSKGRVERLGDEWLAVLDDFESNVMWALPIGQAGLEPVKGPAEIQGKLGLKIVYNLGRGRWVGTVIAPPGRFDLSTATRCHLWLRTDLNARVVIVLEEGDGTRYDTALKPPPDNNWHRVLIPIEDFTPADADTDENGKLDPGQINRVIILVDTFDADVRPGGAGSVAIDDIGLTTAASPIREPD